jgi:hypothetical protein
MKIKMVKDNQSMIIDGLNSSIFLSATHYHKLKFYGQVLIVLLTIHNIISVNLLRQYGNSVISCDKDKCTFLIYEDKKFVVSTYPDGLNYLTLSI